MNKKYIIHFYKVKKVNCCVTVRNKTFNSYHGVLYYRPFIVHAYRKTGGERFQQECAVKHHFAASLYDNSNIELNLINLKVLKCLFVHCLSNCLHTVRKLRRLFSSFQPTLSILQEFAFYYRFLQSAFFFIFTTCLT